MASDIPLSMVHWKPSWRVIPTRYPEINLWKRVVDPGHEPAVLEIEQMTNNRVRQELGEFSVLRACDFFPKDCPIDVKASFVYRGYRSRFSTSSFGAYYAAKSLKTAVYEKAHRTFTLLREANIASTHTEMRVIKSEIRAKLHDIRGRRKRDPQLYDPRNYTASQAWAARLWAQGSEGIVYDSVRDAAGQCVAIFSPQKIANCHKDRILTFKWDGVKTISIGEVREYLRFQE